MDRNGMDNDRIMEWDNAMDNGVDNGWYTEEYSTEIF